MNFRNILKVWFVTLLFPSLLSSQVTDGKLAKLSTDFDRYGLKKSNVPENWEDGFRTNGEKGTLEWWYFDAHLDDGTAVVIVFNTKNFVNIKKGLTPYITINIDKPNGEKIERAVSYEPELFSASKDSCNVQIGDNYFRGNLKNYEIHYEDEDLNITAKIDRTSENWRPETGYYVFGKDEAKEGAWVVAVPQGEAHINYSYKGEAHNLKGSCYHDHNWANVSLAEVFNHWYWARAEIGPYNVIASEMISEKEFNNDNIVVFNVSKDGKTIADNGSAVKLYRTYGKMHPELHKDVSDDIVFVYDSPEDEFRYEFYLHRKKNLVESDLLKSAITNKFKYRMAKLLTGFNGAYFRMTGTAEIRVYKKGQLVEKYESPTAVWELMCFGEPNK